RADNRRLWQVASLEECAANPFSFYAEDDDSTGKLYVNLGGEDPDTRYIEGAVRPNCIKLHRPGAIRNLTVEKSASEAFTAAEGNIRVQLYNNQRIEDVISRYGHG